MSVLIGDVILQARQLFADLPQFLIPVAGPAVVSTATGSLPVGVYFYVATVTTIYGESLPSLEGTFTITTLGQIATIPVAVGSNVLSANLYFTQANGGTGNENQYAALNAAQFTGAVASFNIIGPTFAGTPPTTSNVYDPNTSGPYASASALFYWLSEGLKLGSRYAGGLPDMSGVQSTLNAPSYQVTGEWIDFTDCWYDGYPLSFGTPGQFFARNNVTSSILASVALTAMRDILVVDVWPQPGRTPISTTLTAAMLPADTQAICASGGFLLPFGMMQIGTELVRYGTQNGNTFASLIRGLGGTVPQAWPFGTPVLELNLFWQGNRVFNTNYTPGMSTVTLPCPAGWDSFLISFLLSKYYESEKDGQNQKAKLDEFKTSIKDWAKTNRMTLGPLQAGGRDQQFVVFGGTRWGGNVIQ